MRRFSILISILAIGCEQGAPGGGEAKDLAGSDIDDALALLPEATVIERHEDGLPRFVIGELAKIDGMQIDDPAEADALLRGSLPPVLAVFRLDSANLALRKMNVDDEGGRVFRYQQMHEGLPVIGGDLVVHVDIKGAIHAVNGTARGDLPDDLGANAISQRAALTAAMQDPRFAGLGNTSIRPVYIQTAEGTLHKAYEAVLEGMRGADPVRDHVYIDVDTGAIVAAYPQIHFARNRRIHSANNGTSLPGTLKRVEGGAATNDSAVNASYENSGATYDAYFNFWNRDSYNNNGAALSQTVHYSTNYCNAFWNGSQMVYGDGNPNQGCGSLALSLDVTAHEMTHAVTQHESGLVYSGESGGINEAFSDMFGAFVEAWTLGGRNGTLANTNGVWLIGDEVLAPFLRSMCDPAADGASRDVWSSSLGNVDVHFSSGPANLMFCLLSKGGTHPRGKTNVNVPGIGMAKAIRIVYKAQTDILTSTSKYANLRTAMEQASTSLGYDQATRDAVGCAFAAIAVGSAPATCGGTTPPPPPPGEGVLQNGVAVGGLSAATGNERVWRLDVPAGQTSLTFTITGGSGDADLYVQAGSAPTRTVYQCRPYKTGNVETCTFSPPAQGTYYVMLHAYEGYAGVTLTGTYTATQSGDPYLTSGAGIGVQGAKNSAGYWRIATPAGKTLTVKISGGSGDADLYTRFGTRPTTSTYDCRPYVDGNNETCTAQTQAGDYYVMVRGYSAFSGVTLVASY
jgi:vibriolysin